MVLILTSYFSANSVAVNNRLDFSKVSIDMSLDSCDIENKDSEPN